MKKIIGSLLVMMAMLVCASCSESDPKPIVFGGSAFTVKLG